MSLARKTAKKKFHRSNVIAMWLANFFSSSDGFTAQTFLETIKFDKFIREAVGLQKSGMAAFAAHGCCDAAAAAAAWRRLTGGGGACGQG